MTEPTGRRDGSHAIRLDKMALAATADERAMNAERRAERAREHAAIASEHALEDAAAGNLASERRHAREADLHARAAKHQVAAAALQRLHAAHLRGYADAPPAEDPPPD